ncbi:hypothetical protein ACQ4PT_042424 [Festuca glaucescens]
MAREPGAKATGNGAAAITVPLDLRLLRQRQRAEGQTCGQQVAAVGGLGSMLAMATMGTGISENSCCKLGKAVVIDNTPKEAEMHVLRMIEDGEIHATINQKDGMVSFHEDPEKSKSSEMVEHIDSSIERMWRSIVLKGDTVVDATCGKWEQQRHVCFA